MHARVPVFFASSLPFLSLARSVIALTVGLARDHLAAFSSFDILVTGHLHDEAGNVATKAYGTAERSSVTERGVVGARDAG